ncbi:hypothetical protein JANAI62_24680 [Jannaschia pagri]|uniref:Methyltransferase, LIC12133 family n=1 Tax=Jannaschia pagri TaxID=2829797 RepID=A0ABQ4NN64_9RHOB|nr:MULTISPECIES: methyltransferase, TIGR04325 family [unclassified Jannaschia]GIT92011.1 hypothetical protein JANAI61_24690 [Jannaschia sp. AI_61]GIT95845.1 hypothetical protein JANAI62_24680 [Jannaschia sp. AI_62]
MGGLRRTLRRLRDVARAMGARLSVRLGRAPRFSGAYSNRTAALAAIPPSGGRGYNDPAAAEVSFPEMCQREVWDYPLLHWLDRLLPNGSRVLDAGGHMGTKYIAFSDLIDLNRAQWTVYDTPAIIGAAQKSQIAGTLPSDLRFVDDLTALPETDILLASGLLQYLDISLTELVDALPERPAAILLNKVALRHGPALFTLERLGPVQTPYQIRSWDDWRAELSALGYEVVDRWQIYDLGHRIPTHPQHGESESWGFVLRPRMGA